RVKSFHHGLAVLIKLFDLPAHARSALVTRSITLANQAGLDAQPGFSGGVPNQVAQHLRIRRSYQSTLPLIQIPAQHSVLLTTSYASRNPNRGHDGIVQFLASFKCPAYSVKPPYIDTTVKLLA